MSGLSSGSASGTITSGPTISPTNMTARRRAKSGRFSEAGRPEWIRHHEVDNLFATPGAHQPHASSRQSGFRVLHRAGRRNLRRLRPQKGEMFFHELAALAGFFFVVF